jgi:hypothetical protein
MSAMVSHGLQEVYERELWPAVETLASRIHYSHLASSSLIEDWKKTDLSLSLNLSQSRTTL